MSIEKHPLPSPQRHLLLSLFWQFFKIALFVVGGGYAIIAVADDIFGRRLKWLKEGELMEHLPVFQMVPGIIAGNAAIYTGLKLAGRLGAAVALVGVVLPSLIIFTLVSCGYEALPLDAPILAGIFTGLRASLAGIIGGAIVSGWRKGVKGAYGYCALAVCAAALWTRTASTATVLLLAAGAGIALEWCGLGDSGAIESAGVEVKPLSRRNRVIAAVATLAALAAITLWRGRLYWTFVKFGLMCFGGGFVLVPAYIDEFVGPSAPMLQLPMHEFGDVMALTQMTPGPVGVNCATFFGFRTAGIAGAVAATLGLFSPSYFLLTTALGGLERWKENRVAKGLLRGVRPATIALMVVAFVSFASLALWGGGGEEASFSPLGCALAVISLAAALSRRLSAMAIIFGCAAVGAIVALV